MKTKTNINNLQKSSVLFLQLGLVLTLFTVYTAFELKTEQRVATVIVSEIDTDDIYTIVSVKEIEIERKSAKTKVVKTPKKQASTDFVINDTPSTSEDLPFEAPDPDKENPVVSNIVEVVVPEEFIETIPYTNIQEVPIFPGCEKVKKSKKRACFEKKLHKFIQKKFNSELANQLGLPSGVQKIYVQFIISKTGEIEVLGSKASHKKLMVEGKRVVNKLPTMIPGKQNGEKVGVKYILPISFRID